MTTWHHMSQRKPTIEEFEKGIDVATYRRANSYFRDIDSGSYDGMLREYFDVWRPHVDQGIPTGPEEVRNMEQKTTWIRWEDRAPTEADLPIEYAAYGDSEPRGVKYSTIGVMTVDHYDLWRPYICDIPKAEDTKWPVGYNGQGICTRHMFVTRDGEQIALDIYPDGKTIVWNEEKYIKAQKATDPSPDANGWWRIEDKKPTTGMLIKFTIKSDSDLFPRVGRIDVGTDEQYVASIHCRYLLDELDAWCPIDMTGPVEG